MQEKSGLYKVEAQDELSMILHVIGTAAEEKLIFIVDEEGRTFHNAANLRVIKSYAQDRERELVLVSGSLQLERLCAENQIPCFATVEEARGNNFPKIARPKRGWLGAAITLAALLSCGFFYAAQKRAVLVVTPAARQWQGELVLTVDLKALGSPGDKELTLTGGIQPTGRKTVGVKPAKGNVRFFNNSGRSVTVPKGTAVATTGGRRYLVEKEIVVPKQEKKYVMTVPVGVSAGQATVSVVAAVKGTAGNLAVGRLTKLEGQLADKLQVINTVPLSGGEDREIPVVTNGDLTKLKQVLQQQARSKLKSGLADQEGVFFSDSDQFQQLTFTPQAALGQSLERLTGTLQIKASGYVLTERQISRLIAQSLAKQGNWQPERNLSWEILAVESQAQKCLVKMKCQGTLVGKISVEKLTQNITGKTKNQAERYLGSLPEVDSFQLSVSRKKLPRWRKLIKVVQTSEQ